MALDRWASSRDFVEYGNEEFAVFTSYVIRTLQMVPVAKKKLVAIVLFACSAVGCLPTFLDPALAKDAPVQPSDATGWFRRASDQMNIRQSGSPPFHLKVIFHALPGIELTDKPQIITGDGVYEETWISRGKWRREVTLGSYHAIEVQSERDRKVQAGSDYEPSRVLMLMESLFNPVPRDLVNPDLSGRVFWTIKSQSAVNLSYVSISRKVGSINPHTVAYIFLSNGILVQSNDKGLLSSWQDEVLFGGKAVPKRFSVEEEGKTVLTAEVEISPPGEMDPALFNLPNGSPDEGLTLTPLHRYETRHLELLNPGYSYFSHDGSIPFVFRYVVDRHGVVRELELVDGPSRGDIEINADFQRRLRWRPADIDGSPCEVVYVSYA